MCKKIQIIAIDKEKALELAKKKIAATIEGDLENKKIEIKDTGKKTGFLCFGKKKKFEVIIKEINLSQREEALLDIVSDGLDIDGIFKTKVADEGVFLKVIPPQGNGDPVRYQIVKLALEKREIVQIDWKYVQDAIHEAEGEWVKIAPRLPELDRDADLKVEISNDKFKAYISLIPALGGKDLSVDDIFRILKENNVVYGIDKKRVADLVINSKEAEHLLIAKGTPPVDGNDAQFNYFFEKEKTSVGTKREDGSIDYYDLGNITNVNQGEVLVTKDDPVPGKPGKTVTGEVINPPEPKDKELPGGKNVERKDDKTLVSTINGQVILDGKRIKVLPIYEVYGDVDLSTGNIDFVGNVIVKGNVTEGFKIKASGNVEVKGHVFAADIEAGGVVLINKGYVGKNKYHIHAQGNVQSKYVENGIIKSEKDVIVSDAIMHSDITAGSKVEATKNKGLIVGGVIRAGNLIEANLIGSHLATSTKLEVGIDPEIKNKSKGIEEELKKDKINLDKTLKAVDILRKLKSQRGKLPEEKKLMLFRLESTATKLQEVIDKKKMDLKNLNEKFESEEKGRINICQKVYPGVKMLIGNSAYNVYNTMNRTSFIEDEGEVRQLTL